MALIQCPECGKSISDKAVKCPQCGYPISEQKKEVNSDVQEQKNNDAVLESKKVKSKKPFIIVAVIILIIVAFAIITLSQKNKSSVNVSEIKINKWRLISDSDYFDNFEGKVTSDDKSSFIALIGNYNNSEDNAYKMVYMENGEGIIQTYEVSDTDPSTKYTGVGYLCGKSVDDSYIKSVKFKDGDYNDYEALVKTSCTVNIDIELKSKKDGLLFFELKNDLTKEIRYNGMMVIVDGIGHYEYYLSDLPLKSRGVEITLTPKFFCESKKIKEEDLTIDKNLVITKDNDSSYFDKYSGTGEYCFEGYDDGIILYSSELVDGGIRKDQGIIRGNTTQLKNGKCKIEIYNSYDKDEKALTPNYEFKFIGYLKYYEL